jgi:hypothetical protein
MNGEAKGEVLSPKQRWLDRLLACLPYASLMGVAGLVANLVLSFEEPHGTMLLVGGVLIIAAPAGLVLHLWATSELTGDEKRLWLAGLASWRGPALFAAYFSGAQRGRATRRLCRAESHRA